MKLKYVTFTGVDNWTNLDSLERIQQQYPYAEFGVLASYHYSENGPRFPDKWVFDNLKGRKLNLSLHLCGTLALKAVQTNLASAIEFMGEEHFNLFKRVQINMHLNNVPREQIMALTLKGNLEQIVIQMHTTYLCRQHFALGYHNDCLGYLLDSSGGAGIDTPLEIITKEGEQLGYAGGIGVNNVWSKLQRLLRYNNPSTFWIDMETRVRTGEKLDLELVDQVLALSDVLIKRYNDEPIENGRVDHGCNKD